MIFKLRNAFASVQAVFLLLAATGCMRAVSTAVLMPTSKNTPHVWPYTTVKPGGSNVITVHCHQTVGGHVIDVGIAAAQ